MLRKRYPHGLPRRTYIYLHIPTWGRCVCGCGCGTGGHRAGGAVGGGGWLDRVFLVFLKPPIEDHFPTHQI